MSRLDATSILMLISVNKLRLCLMAGAPEKDETVTIRMAVPKALHVYLGMLRDRTMLGASENDVAKYLLTQRLEQMLKERYHETQAIPSISD